MTNLLKDFVRDETGAAAAEYALILAIVGAGIAGAAFLLGSKISASMSDTATKIENCGGANATSGC